MSELRSFNPCEEIRHTEKRLPHWQQQGAVYFVTFRLADAIPAHLRDEWESERATWLRLLNLGALRLNSSITSVSPERSSAGSTLAMGRVFFGNQIARK